MPKKKELPMMITISRAKDYIQDVAEGTRCSGEFMDALNEKIASEIGTAIERCKANNRATLKPADL